METNNTDTINKVQQLVRDEFTKTFQIKLDNANYKIALRNDEIPLVKSYKLGDGVLIIYFVDDANEILNDEKRIFNIHEDLDGKLQSASISFNDLTDNNSFKTIRKEIKPLYDIKNNSSSLNELIDVEKKFKLLHVIYDFLKRNNSNLEISLK